MEYLACVALAENLGSSASVKGLEGLVNRRRIFSFTFTAAFNLVAGMSVTNDLVGARETTMKARRRTSSYTICSRILELSTREKLHHVVA